MKDGPHRLAYRGPEGRRRSLGMVIARVVAGVIIGPFVAVILAFWLILIGPDIGLRIGRFAVLDLVAAVAMVVGAVVGVLWAIRPPRRDRD